MSNKKIPAVSVVIPMYNTEKYIGECLESILAQTFQDFEVIVVDDCSTDNSRAVVESYLSKFEQRNVELKLICSEKNSGASGIPRHIGLHLSHGEYISFIDADDMITKTALEELYPIAQKFDADVVHCEKYFEINADEVRICQSGELIKEPTLITENLAERVNDLYNDRFIDTLWSKLIRREFFIQKNISPLNGMAADAFISFCLICSAKKYVRVPNIINFYRRIGTSITKQKRSIQKSIDTWMISLTQGFQYMDEFLSNQKFFQENPEAKFVMLEIWVRAFCDRADRFRSIYTQIPAWQLDELIRNELEKVKNKSALTAFLFSRMNVFNVQLNRQQQIIFQQQQIIQQLKAQLKK